MKKRTNLFAMLLAMLLAVALALPAFAAEVTIRDNSEISTYAATRSYNGYKLLNLTISTKEDETNYAYTVNEKYRSVLQSQVFEAAEGDFWEKNGGSKPTAATSVTDAQILAYLGTLTSDSDETSGTLRNFADDLYKKISSMGADAEAHNATFGDMDQGYWLIADVTDLEGTGEANSLVIVDTKGQDSITVTPKTDVPEVEKKVKEENDSTGNVTGWQDVADYDIGDNVPFQLTGTMPSNIANYKTYKYIFHDDLSTGLTLNVDSITVKIDGTQLEEDTDYTVNTSPSDATNGCDFEIVFNDILSIGGVTITKESKVVVEYTAKLTSDAAIGNPGNPNKVYLEFSNNPYAEGTGKTPEDKVTVFTFELDVDKVDKNENPLEGAGFTLYKYDADTQNYVVVGREVTGDQMTKFVWSGLDSGKYKLVESTVPAGYNKADDIEFTIEAEYTTDGADQTLKGLVVKNADGTKIISGDNKSFAFTANVTSGTIATNVVNTTGTKLPTTGGMGTTLFYVLGGILVVGAGVLLVAKKRMGDHSEQ